ncbi:hypothetical protein HOLleu_00828 [Holothuria leucospilota]|uniref:Uncharacterized protein n=1 Tax=Holothuria leucospilota TaxID=206669 RepID=A0A9Q1CPZ7_HOLLE|nr:hypothetical protein HOLleu_00828 [Holothuria leucospilota]
MYTNISHFINLLGVKFFSHTLFYDIQGKHLIPVINSFYSSQTEDILSSLSASDLELIGDGRCDSPGYSAKYCSYTMMPLTTHQIVTSEFVQVSQASTVAMEKLGFSKCVEKVGETNRIGLIATDRHAGIRKL